MQSHHDSEEFHFSAELKWQNNFLFCQTDKVLIFKLNKTAVVLTLVVPADTAKFVELLCLHLFTVNFFFFTFVNFVFSVAQYTCYRMGPEASCQ